MIKTTDVKFLYHPKNDDLFAYFPNDIFDSFGNKSAYSHVGQHSACSTEYVTECRLANISEYKELLNELTNIGYNLNVLN